MDLSSLSTPDIIGVAGFVLAWALYVLLIDHGPLARHTLSASMDRQRRSWVEYMQAREIRIADTNILAGLQTGTGFFASASMLAIGACIAVFGSSDTVATVIEDIVPTAIPTDAALFDAKIVGLAVIFVYAFFKFSWAYRLFNYASLLVGALPPAKEAGTPPAKAAIDRAVIFLRLGGKNFNRGQRAFFFSIAYLAWLVSPWLMLAGTAVVIGVLVHRQFWSQPAKGVRDFV